MEEGRDTRMDQKEKRERKTVFRKTIIDYHVRCQTGKTISSTIMTNWIVDDSEGSVGGQTSARFLSIIDYHQLSLTIMRRFTRALRETLYPHKVSVYPDVC